MTTIVAGEGLGLASAVPVNAGAAGLGEGGGEVLVNAANGNLVLQVQDEWLAAAGLDVAVSRTYNSQGLLDDDNADNWRIGLYRNITGLSGTLNAAGSSVIRTDGDGMRRVYVYDTSRGAYLSSDGGSGIDSLAFNAATAKWTWTDGDGRAIETYDWSGGAGKLLQVADADGNSLVYTYTGSLLTLVTDTSGEKTFLDYSGNNLTQVRVVKSDASTSTAVRYGYDASNRLSTVTVDLSPDDNSIADGKTYTTTYTYDGTSKRVASVAQSDGTSLAFTYVQVNGRYCVASVTDALGRVTSYSYAQAAWGTPATLESLGVAVYDPQVELDATGNGFALWRENGNLWISRFDVASGTWQAPANLSTRSTAVATPQLALDGSGNAVVAWVQSDGTANTVFASRYNPGSGAWSTPVALESLSTAAADPQVAVNASGKAIVVWRQPASGTTTPNNLYASRFDGSAWSAPALLETNAADITAPATVALDADGNASVAWLQDAVANIYLTRYTAATNTWSTPSSTAIETGSAAASNVQIAFDGKGNGQAIYLQGGNLMARSYSAATNTWGSAKTLENATYAVVAAQVSLSANGNALVTWVQSNGTANSVYARRCIGGTWLNNAANADTGDVLEALSTAASSASGAIADNGDAVVLWRQPAASGAVNSVYASRFMGNAWQAAELVESSANDVTQGPAVAMDAAGSVQALWQQSDGSALSIYGARFNLATTTQTDALGQQTRYTTDSHGQLAAVQTPTARSVYASDTAGNLIRQTDALGRTTVYEYDANGNRTLSRDTLGNTVTSTYGSKNELLTETEYLVADPDGAGSGQASAPQTTRYAYDAENHLRFEVSAAGRVTEHRYNAAGQLVSTLDYTGNTYDVSALAPTASLSESTLAAWAAGTGVDRTRFARTDTAYDFRGQVASQTAYAKTDSTGTGIADGTQATTQSVYDPRGRLLQRISAKGVASTGVATDGITSYTYDGLGRELTCTDSLGNTSTTQYDAANRKIVSTQANGLVSTSVFDAAGQLISLTQSEGVVTLAQTRYWYDAGGRACMTQDATGVRQFTLFDAEGRQAADIDGNGSLTEYTYDADGRLVGTLSYATALSGTALASLVDANGNPTNPALATLRPAASGADIAEWIFYDAAGRVVKTVDGEGAVVQSFYDGAGQLTDVVAYAATVSPSGITTATQAGDAAVSPSANANDRRTRHFYDADGLRVATLDAAGYLSETQYDAAGRAVHTIGYATQAPSAYWTSGTLAQLRPAAAAADQHTWQLYDGRDNVIAEVDAEGNLTEHLYDANGHQTQQIAYANKALVAPTAITATTTLGALRPASSSQDQTNSWTYTDLGQVATATNAQGTVTRYTYDGVGNVLKTDAAYGTSELRTLQARYDKLGRVVAELSARGSAALAALGSPTQAQIDGLWAQYGVSYSYDQAGHRSAMTDVAGNRTLYYYDADGQLVYTINALGEVSEVRYDVLGRAVRTIAHGARLSASTLATLNGGLADATATNAVAAIANAGVDSVQRVAYDRRGLANVQIDALGNVDYIAYDAFGGRTYTTERIDAATTVDTSFTYDKRGQLTKTVEDPGGLSLTTSTVYDAFGRAVQTTDPRGIARSVQYDRLGRAVQTTDGLGTIRRTSYDAFDRVLSQTDGLGNTTAYAYDSTSRSMTVTTPEGVTVVTRSNRHGQVVSVTNGLGQTTTETYDADGQLTATTDALGRSSASTYDTAGQLATTTDASGVTTQLSYDAAGRVLTRSVDPAGLNLVTRYQYDPQGRLLIVTDPSGVVTQTSYDLQGQVTQVAVDPAGLNLRTAYTYDAQGRALTVIRGAGTAAATTTRYAYDELGRRISEAADPDGLNLVTRYQYDGDGNVVVKTDATGNATRYAYDAENRLAYTLDALGGASRTDYDAEGRVLAVTRFAMPASGLSSYAKADFDAHVIADASRDQVARSVYDKDGREVYSIDALGEVVQRQFDADGRVLQATAYANPITLPATLTPASVAAAITASANDRTTRYVYDAAGQQRYTLDALGYVSATTYDAAGRVIGSTSSANAVSLSGNPTMAAVAAALVPNSAQDRTSYSVYDSAGRLADAIDAEGYVTRFAYDAAGRVTSTTHYPASVGVLASAPSLASLQALLPATVPSTAAVTQQTYDTAGRLLMTVDGEGIVTRRQLDALGRATSITVGDGRADAATTSYSYDAAGRLTQTVEGAGSLNLTTRYQYDTLGRQTGLVDARGVELAEQDNARAKAQRQALGYVDANGNAKLAASLTAAEKQALMERYTSHTAYDALGRKTQYTDALDNTTQYRYDAFGQLTKVTDPRGNAGYFYYDRLGRQVLHVDPLGNGIATAYDFAGAVVSQTRYANAATGAWSEAAAPAFTADATRDATTLTRYDRLGRRTGQTDAEGFVQSWAYDGLDNVTSRTNALGGVTSYTYDRRGLVLSETLPITSKNASGVDTAVVNRYSYDARGHRTQSIEAAGLPEQRTTTYTYDEADRLITKQGIAVLVMDAAFNAITATPTETYTYDARGNRILVDVNGHKTYAWYDAADRKIASADAVGTLTKWTLDAAGNAVQQDIYGDPVSSSTASVPTPVNAANVRTTYSAYDANNRLTKTWQVADNVYDYANGLRSNVQVAAQNTYDADGNLVRSIDPNGNSTWSYYDKAGRKVMQVDAEGYVVGWGYDAMSHVTAERKYAGRLSAATLAGLSASTDTAALRGELVASPDVANDRITTYAYDRMGRLVRQGVQNVAYATVDATTGVLSEASGEVVTRTTYNGLGEVLTSTDANGGITTSSYDLTGRETRKELPAFTDYAGNANVHQATETSYDGLGNVLTRTDKGLTSTDDRVTRYTYNANGWMTTETDALGNVTRYAYDVYGNLVRKIANRLESVGNFASGTLADTWDKQPTWIVSNGAGGTRTVLDPIAAGGASGSLKPYLADWNGDGRTDMLWFDANSGSNRFYLDNGDGTFQVLDDPIAASDLAGSSGVYTGDFNGDGKADILWWDKATGNTRWFINNGNGTFTRSDNLIAATDVAGGTGLYLGDFNGDGRLDVLWWDQASGNNTWFTRNADGTWTKAASRIATADIKNGTSLLVGDFNGDGRADLMWYDRATGNNLWWFANADGTLSKVLNAITATDLKNGTGLYTADWTGNGTADLLWYDAATRTSRWYEGSTSRSFSVIANPIAAGTVSQSGNQRFGDMQGNGLVLRDEMRFVFDAMGRETRRDDLSANMQQNTRYDAYGAITAKGFFGQWTETTEYDRQGRVWRTSTGNGVPKAYVYDADGNATLTIQSAGAALGGMTLAQMLASSDVKPTITVYDKRNLVTDVIEPQMSFTHQDAAIQSVQVLQQVDPFTGGTAVASAGSVATTLTGSVNGAMYLTIGLTIPNTSAWGSGDYTVEVTRANGPYVGTTTYTYAGTSATVQLPALPFAQTYPDQFGYMGHLWHYDQTLTIKVTKQTAYGSITVSNETRTFDLNSGALKSTTGSAALPKLLHFEGQPLDADNLRLKYRVAGSTGAYTEVLLSKYQVNGSSAAGWFAFDWSSLAANTYEYVYEALDADNANKVLNRVSGSFKIDGDNTAVQSQTAQPLDPVYVTQLQWVITGQQDRANQVRRSQQHNAFGEVTAEIDGLGRRTDFSYNALGKLLLKTDPETSVTLANGFVTRARPQTRYYYDKAGQVVGTQDANGNRTTMRYTNAFDGDSGDVQGQVAQEYFADGGTRSYAYDVFGELVKTTDQLGQATLNGYDKNGDLVSVDRPGADDDTYQYDLLGNRTGHVDALGNREVWRHDSQGRITQAVSASGRRTDYDYAWVGDSWTTTNADDALSPTSGLAAPGGWLKRTTYGDGKTLQELSDAQDRLRWKRDLGGKDTLYTYNQAGWLTSQTSDRGQNISYTYYDNGNVKTITDTAANTFSKFEYDTAGNRTFEGYTTIPDAQGNRSFFQYSNISYDELNRMTSEQSADYRIDYEYDAVGNRRHMLSYYHDGLNGNASTQDYWYLYDGMNRFVVTLGTLSGGRATDATAAARIVKGTTGVDIQYDLASQRRVATYGRDGHKEEYAYNADGFLTTTTIDGVLRAARTNDALGRVANYKEYNADGSVRTNTTTSYDKDGRTLRVNDDLTAKGSNYAYLNDGTLASTTTYGDATTVTTSYAYEWFDSAKEKEIKVQASNQSAPGWKPGYSKFTYDANGNLQLVEDVAANRSLRYVTSGEGQVLRRQELVGTTISKTHNFYYANGVKVGDVGNDGQSQEDYAQDLAKQKNLSASEQNKRYKPQAVANFDQNYEPIDADYPGSNSGSYVVRSGDTLQSIARAVWGDGSLWYLIADANGLSASSALVAGQTLVIPNKVTNIHNSADTFSVYQPGSAIGDVSPTLPEAPAPRVKKSSKGKSASCGRMLLGILVAVVAVAATVVTAGAFMVAATPLTMSAGPMAMLGAGVSAVSGGAAGWAGVGAAMVGAAAGSAVGQGLSVITGLQGGFSWSQVAASALTAGVTAGIGKLSFLPRAGLLKGRLGTLANAAIGGAASNAASQLATKFVNPQARFNWTAVAGAGIGAAIGTQGVVSSKFAKTHPLLAKGVNTFVQNAATQESNNLLGLHQGVSLRAAGVAAGKAIVDDLGKATYVPLLSRAMSKENALRLDGVVREVVQEGVRWGVVRGRPDLADFWKEAWALTRSLRPSTAAAQPSTGGGASGTPRGPGLGRLLSKMAERTFAKALEEAGSELGKLALGKVITHKAAPAFSFGKVAAAGIAGGLGSLANQAIGARHPEVAKVLKEGIAGARGQFFKTGLTGGWAKLGWAFADGVAAKSITVGNEWAGHALNAAAHSALRTVPWRTAALVSMGITAAGRSAHLFFSAGLAGTLGRGTGEGIVRSLAAIGLGGLAAGGVMAFTHKGAGAAADAVSWIDGKLGASGAAREALDRFTGEFAKGEDRALVELGARVYSAGVSLIQSVSARTGQGLYPSLKGGPQMLSAGSGGDSSTEFDYRFQVGWQTFVVKGGSVVDRMNVEDATREVLATPRGKQMLDVLQNRGMTAQLLEVPPFYIDLTVKDTAYAHKLNSDTIMLDPKWKPGLPEVVRTPLGAFEELVDADLRVVIGHEMGHAVMGDDDNGPRKMNNVTRNENPIRRALGLPERSSYLLPGSEYGGDI